MDPELKIALLKTHFGKSLDLYEAEMLLSCAKIIVFDDGHVLLQQGHCSDGIYIILTGSAKVTARVIGKGEIDLTMLEAGNIVGGVTLLSNAVSTISIVAKTLTKCIYIPKAYFDMLSLFSPATKFKINSAIMEEILFRLKNMHTKITSFMLKSDMMSRSILDGVIHSLAFPKKISIEESGITNDQLKSHDFFSHLSEEDFLYILQYADMYDAVRYCTLLKEGEKTSDCYLILRGAVQSSFHVEGKTAKLAVLAPHSVFCGTYFVSNISNMINFVTCERTIFLKLSSANLDTLKNKKIELWYYLYDIICHSYASLTQAANRLEIRLNSEIYNR